MDAEMLSASPLGDVSAFLEEARRIVGQNWVDASAVKVARYGENLMPTGDVQVAGVVYPGSTEEIRQLVISANRNAVSLYPVSTGQNIGMGSRAPVMPGQVVVELGRRMNRILELNEEMAYVVVEPGVSYQALYDELAARGHPLMLDTTSGPPQGGPLGNTLDKGAGYTPYFDHFYMSCGMEVVLGTGEVLRTGDGALPGSKSWHISKYGLGPYLDGLFLQSNYGIVTRMGVWLMPKPAVTRSFFFSYPDDDDLAEIMETARFVKLRGVVPTLLKVTNDIYAFGTESRFPQDRADLRATLPDDIRREMQREHGIGSWVVSGAVYAASEAAADAQVETIRQAFEKTGKATYIPQEIADENPMLRIHSDSFVGKPTRDEFPLYEWRPGGGATWILPVTPIDGKIALEHQALSRNILRRFGFDYICEHVVGARMSRALHVLVWNREDPEENARAEACYKAFIDEYAAAGYPVSRPSTAFQPYAMNAMGHHFLETCNRIKDALDPNGVLAPGRYGIGAHRTP
ncbi:FAD-binding oxidoreductase [Novosphingobium sp.]|uniref:FAD-binding oxidoreductase n=1 Tax=Novosphingobium sp. TaxID=1874826 RepID=UPI002B470C6B|nr:FAD-binding oxidoreductase [Novosphingobium sp.]HKR93477.1 FAD-binding oxidoreductase [Novosphingobium sp.]